MNNTLSFENNGQWTIHAVCFLPIVQIKDCNAIIDRMLFFDQPVKKSMRTYGILKMVKGMITQLGVC